MINLNNLRIFHMIAKYNSVTIAARHLYISQPAVSNALKKIQKDNNVNLFTKSGRQLILTEQGKELYNLTKELFQKEEDVENYFKRCNKELTHTINIGLTTLYDRFSIPEIISYFGENNSEIVISIQSGNSNNLLQLLKDKQIDIAIVGDHYQDSALNLTKTFYKSHDILLVIPKGHRLFGKKIFSAKDIANEKIVLKDQGSGLRAGSERFFQENNISPNIYAELSSLDSMLQIAKSENCLTFLTDMAINNMLSNNKDFSIASPCKSTISMTTYVVTQKEESFTPVMWKKIQTFLDAINLQSSK